MLRNQVFNHNSMLGGPNSIWELLILVGVIIIVSALIVNSLNKKKIPVEAAAIEQLQLQYANGTIDEEVFLRRKAVLLGKEVPVVKVEVSDEK